MKKVTEKSFMAAVVQYARLKGWRIFHPFDSRRSAAGWPDLALVKGGVLVLAELKVGTNTPTAAQVAWLHALDGVESASLGAVIVRVWTPGDWATIERILGGES